MIAVWTRYQVRILTGTTKRLLALTGALGMNGDLPAECRYSRHRSGCILRSCWLTTPMLSSPPSLGKTIAEFSGRALVMDDDDTVRRIAQVMLTQLAAR